MDNIAYCLTTTIDNSSIGKRYYHNIKDDNNVVMRPRIPLRYDLNDVDIVEISREKARELLGPGVATRGDIYWLRRTGYSITNSLLLQVLSIILLTTSVINMRKIASALQEDTTLSTKNKALFRVVFVLSFIVVLFLVCFMSISIFELFRNFKRFSSVQKNNVWYKDLLFQDGMFYSFRWIILIFVFGCLLFACAEIINLFFMEDQKQILIVFIPILMCFVLLINLYVLYFNK